MYCDANLEFNFTSGWLERFKAKTWGIKSYQRFGKNGSIVIENKAIRRAQSRTRKDLLLLFYCNGDDSDKVTLSIIGKCANP